MKASSPVKLNSTFNSIKSELIDKWLTFRTGYTKSERESNAWKEKNLDQRASTVKGYFKGFKYIIQVDYDKVCRCDLNIHPTPEFREYCYPQKSLDETVAIDIFRGIESDGEWVLNDLSGTDRVYVATNNEEDALMIAMRFS